MYRIHIVGLGPRSGTTLLAEAMKACFKIDHSTDHEDSIVVHRNGPGNVFLTKNPGDILVVRPFLFVMPKLFVICMIRDPRDMVVSRHGSALDKYWCSLRYWNTYTRFYKRIRRHPRVIAFRYEDLVESPDNVQKTLVKKLPFLTQRATFTEFHKRASPSSDSIDALGGVRPISSSSVGKWRNHLNRIAGQMAIHGDISDDLIEFGYEKDERWLNLLKDIEPDYSQSFWPEFYSRKELNARMKGKYQQAFRFFLSQRGFGLHYIARWI